MKYVQINFFVKWQKLNNICILSSCYSAQWAKKFFLNNSRPKNNKKKCPNEMNPRICLEYYFLQYSESINPFFLSEIDFYVFDFTSFFFTFLISFWNFLPQRVYLKLWESIPRSNLLDVTIVKCDVLLYFLGTIFIRLKKAFYFICTYLSTQFYILESSIKKA